jgi:hypothetical protein
VNTVCGSSAVSRTLVFENASFRNGRENVEDDDHSRGPTAVLAPDMFETVWELILTDSRITLPEILVEDLEDGRCGRFVSQCLPDEQKSLRLQAHQELIQSVDDDCSLHDSFVTGDETWCSQCDLQTKSVE